LPYIASAATGIIVLFASVGSTNIKLAGWGVVGGSSATIVIAVLRETVRLAAIFDHFPAVRSALSYADPATMIGAGAALMSAGFALRVALVGNAAFARSEPRRIRGRRALHGEAEWMKSTEAGKLFPDTGGIVIGERYRVPAGNRFTDLVGLLSSTDIDALMILTSGSHGDAILAGLDRGVAVFAEKPLAWTLAEADAIAARLAADDRSRLQVGYMKLYDPAVVEAMIVAQ
jgi:hypothetical protein